MRRVVILEPDYLVREGIARLLAEGAFAVVDPGRASDLDGPPVQNDSVDLVLTELPTAPYRMASWLERIRAFYPSAGIVLLTRRPTCPEVVRSALACGAQGYVDKDISVAGMHAILAAVLHGQTVCPAEVRDSLLAQDRVTPLRQEEAGFGDGRAPVRRRSANDEAPADSHVVDRTERPDPRSIAGPAADFRHLPRQPAAPFALSEGARALAADLRIALSEREAEVLSQLAEGHANKTIAHRLSISEATVKSHLKSLLRKLHFTNRTQAAIWAVTRARARSVASSADQSVPGYSMPSHPMSDHAMNDLVSG